MARKRGELPAYRQHRGSGRGYVYLDGKQRMLPGVFRSEESLAAYRRIVAEWMAHGGRLAATAVEPLSVADLAADYLEHAEVYYRRRDGSPTCEAGNVANSVRELLELYGPLPTHDFDLPRLKVVREAMVHKGLCRTTVNGRVARIVRMFAWATEELKLPPAVFGALRALRPLKRGRSTAREPEPRRPVPEADFRATLPHLSPTLRALALFLWHTAARVGEAVQLRSRDVEMAGKVWLFAPAQHKLLHRDKPRLIAIGPEAQLGLRPFVKLDPDAYWLSPRDALEQQRDALRAARQTPLWASHLARYEREREEREPRVVGERYEVRAVARAIRRACREAGVKGWSPHQLRHAALSRIRREKGIEAAAAIAGHSALGMTEHYSWEAQRVLALRVAAEVG